MAIHAVAGEAPPLHVVGMSLDPSLLSRAGISVDELKSEAASLLTKAGLPATVADSPVDDGPRLAFAIPAQETRGDGVAVFLFLQYQLPVKDPKNTRILWATDWSRWWGSQTEKSALRAELRRGLKVLIDQFAAWKKGGA